MLLAIDVGNTNTVFGVLGEDGWLGVWRRATDANETEDQLAAVKRDSEKVGTTGAGDAHDQAGFVTHGQAALSSGSKPLWVLGSVGLAQSLLHISLWSSVIFGMASVFSGVMRASGTVMAPTAISILAIAAVEVPVAWMLSRHIGTDGIWAAYPAAFIAMFVMQGAYYGLVWRRRAQRFGIRRMV